MKLNIGDKLRYKEDGDEVTISHFDGNKVWLTRGTFLTTNQVDSLCEHITDPVFDKERKPVEGDVYSSIRDPEFINVIQSNGKGVFKYPNVSLTDVKSICCAGFREIDGGEFLYNIYKINEGATHACTEEEARAVGRIDIKMYAAELGRFKCVLPELETKEAEMLKITKTETLHSDEPDRYDVNGRPFDELADQELIDLIRGNNERVKEFRSDAKDTKCERLGKEADTLEAINGTLVTLFDAKK